MDPDLLALAVDGVLLELGDVMADVVDQVHLQFLPRAAKDLGEHFAGLLHQQLPVAPGEVGGRPHGRDVVLPLRAVDRGAGQLAVGQLDAVFLRRLAQHAPGRRRNLVAQAARAAVDHHADHVLFQAHDRGRFLVEDVIDDLHFQEVVARAERAALLRAAVDGVIADQVGIGPVEPAMRLGVVDVALRRQAAAQQIARPLGQEMDAAPCLSN